MSEVYLVRHARVAEGKSNLTVGHDESLSEIGKKQLPLLAAYFRDKKLNQVFYSPLLRTKQTADAIAPSGVSTEADERIRERQWGELGTTWDEVSQILRPMSIEERYSFVPEGGESWKQFEKRTADFWDEKIVPVEQPVAIVTHEGTLRALLPYLMRERLGGLKSSLEWSVQQNFEPGSVSVFDKIGHTLLKESFIPELDKG